MSTRTTGRRVALVSVVGVVALIVVAAWFGRDHVRFVLEFESLGRNAQGYTEYLHRQTGIVFVELPGGTFLMGSPEDEAGRDGDEGPVHEVSLSPFLISKFELSQDEWARVVEGSGSRHQASDLPVDSISWEDCREFCAITGLSMPTEAQWEYACRAGTITPYSFGERLNRSQANFGGVTPGSGSAAVGEIVPAVAVDAFTPNAFGIHQMHGNVWEWCEDAYDSDFYSRAEATARDPVCRVESGLRTLRGGCRSLKASDCRAADRGVSEPSYRSASTGFRPTARVP